MRNLEIHSFKDSDILNSSIYKPVKKEKDPIEQHLIHVKSESDEIKIISPNEVDSELQKVDSFLELKSFFSKLPVLKTSMGDYYPPGYILAKLIVNTKKNFSNFNYIPRGGSQKNPDYEYNLRQKLITKLSNTPNVIDFKSDGYTILPLEEISSTHTLEDFYLSFVFGLEKISMEEANLELETKIKSSLDSIRFIHNFIENYDPQQTNDKDIEDTIKPYINFVTRKNGIRNKILTLLLERYPTAVFLDKYLNKE